MILQDYAKTRAQQLANETGNNHVIYNPRGCKNIFIIAATKWFALKYNPEFYELEILDYAIPEKELR
jgi:hypothetical protein